MQTINVSHADGSTAKANVTPTVEVAFERHFKTGVGALADKATMRMEYVYWMAWYATTAGRKGRPSFDEWLDTVTAIEYDQGADEAGDDEESVDPLAPTPPHGDSFAPPSSPVPESP